MADAGVSYTTMVLTETTVQVLDTFLKPFEVPKQSKFSNFINQSGSVYHVPTRTTENPDQEFGDHHTFARPIDQFFYQMEECRRRGILLNFCEHQWCYEPVRIVRPEAANPLIKLAESAHKAELVKPPKSPKSSKANTFADDEDELGEAGLSDDDETASRVTRDTGISDTGLRVIPLTKEELQQVYTPDQMKSFQQADHSGIWLDFDILQKDSVRKLGDESYTHIIQGVCRILRDSLDFEGCRNAPGVVERTRGGGVECKIHVVLLRKKDIRPENHHKYGSCYKDSFHIRIPTIKVTRGYKSYLRKQVRDSQELQQAFRDISLVNTLDEIVDSGVVHGSPMLLGSAKRGGREAHAIYKLYTATIRSTDAITMVTTSREFDAIEVPDGNGTPVVRKTRKAAAQTMLPKYKWNLVYETSLLYENPDGLIKKRNFEPKAELLLEIKSLDERSAPGITASADIDMIDHAVKDLCRSNHEAKFLMQCLDILDPKRAENYQSWMRIILTLAKENPEYKPLAIRFSQRCPKQWANNGSIALEKLWNYGLNNPDKAHHDETEGDEALKSRNVRAIYNMAATDNPEAYRKYRGESAYFEFFTKANEFEGKLNETHVGDILEKIFGNKFVTDKMIIGTKGSRVWYSFVTPDRKIQSHKSMYKWRFEADCPDTFDDCLSRTFPEYITKIITHFKVEESKADNDEKILTHYQNTIKGLESMRYALGNQSTIDKYIKRASRIFRRDDFIETLDTAEHVLGTMNGVLVLSPNTELVQAYNDYNITRSVTVDYVTGLSPSIWVDKLTDKVMYAIPHDLSNPYKQAIQMAIEEIHAGEWDALEFNMCYLASSMDHKKKAPMFVIWLGGGANGKSFLLEMFIKMMGDVTRGGYGYKLNASFFTAPGKAGGGPDSQKMGLQYARFAYCSETNQMDKLHTSIIKETTSDTISGNEKFKTQQNFDVNTRFILATNHPTRVEGNDHGIWRRLFVYWFKVTFKENPDPKNKFERKMDPKKIEVWPKDRNFKQAFLSYMMDWYAVYRDKYHSNVLNVPRPTIDRESRKFREDSDVMCKFIKEILEYVGEQYYDSADELEEEKIVDTSPIKLVEVAARYSDWYKANVDPKDVPPGMVIMQQLIKYPEIDKYIVEEGTGSNVLYLTKHILHGVGETWKPKKRHVKKAAATAEDGNPAEGMLPLTHHNEEVVIPEIVRKRNAADMDQDEEEPQELEDQPEWLRRRGDNIFDLADMVFPIAKDDEDVELKIAYPEYNSKEVNETLLAHLPTKERREMISRLGPDGMLNVELDPLAELDDLTDRAVAASDASGIGELDEDEDGPVATERSLINDINRLASTNHKSPSTTKTVKSSLPAATKLDKPKSKAGPRAKAAAKKPKAAANKV